MTGINNFSHDKIPPVTSLGIINLAWSLILCISIDKRDNDVGKEVISTWKNLHQRIVQSNNNESIKYIDNVCFLLYSFIGSIAFERYFYYQYAITFEKKRKQSIDYWNDLADMTSFSTDGIILRITSFLGIGSGVSFLGYLNSLFDTPPQYIAIFLIFGFIGLLTLFIIIRIFRNIHIKNIIVSTLEAEQQYWMNIARENYKKNLKGLYENVVKIQKAFYSDYSKIFEPDLNIDNIIDNILPQQVLFQKIEK